MEKHHKFRTTVRLIIIKHGKILLINASDEKFYYYPGGGVEYGETIGQACVRETAEECDGALFTLTKLLYVRDFLDLEHDDHEIELFILGDVDKYEELEGHSDPEKQSQYQTWIEIEKLPEMNVLPKQLTQRLLSDYHANFPDGNVYIGEM